MTFDNDGNARMATTASIANSSTIFLDLPPELRNYIYELALKYDYHIQPNYFKRDGHQPPLTRTCHQLRHESLPIFYSSNIFRLDHLCYLRHRRGQSDCPWTHCHRLRDEQDRLNRLPFLWQDTIGHHNLQNVRTLLLRGHGPDCAFAVTLRQEVNDGTLRLEADEGGWVRRKPVLESSQGMLLPDAGLDALMESLSAGETQSVMATESIKRVLGFLLDPANLQTLWE